MKLVLLVLSSLVLALVWTVWSFSLTDPNLLYINSPQFVAFQASIRSINVSPLHLVSMYIGLIAMSFILYGIGLKALSEKKSLLRPLVLFTGVLSFILLFANPALSHDLFNYIFNAKMVVIYHANPHIQTALQYMETDTWVRFMHNIHTPAPYGYAWTYMSLLPFIAGLGKFLTTFLAFKLFMFLGFGALVTVQVLLLQKEKRNVLHIAWFILNPLVLLETMMNGHNDVWMMALFMLSILLLRQKQQPIVLLILSTLFMAVSTQIKLATVVLIPIWGVFAYSFVKLRISLVHSLVGWVQSHWADVGSMLLFFPLLTSRSQLFHPWYFIWPLTFLPFVRFKLMRVILVLFSLTSMVRYSVFLYLGEYSSQQLLLSQYVTWAALVGVGLYIVWGLITAKHPNRIASFIAETS